MPGKIDKDDFAQWRDSRITQEVMGWANTFAQTAREEWTALLEQEPTYQLMKELPTLFMELRAKMITASDFASVELSDIQPEEENPDGPV